MTEYSMHLISRLDPLRYLFDRPTLVGRLMRWAIDDDFLDEDVAAMTSLLGWRMYFDGTANHSGYGICVFDERGSCGSLWTTYERAYTNGAVEAVNKNIKRILRRMIETSRDWLEKLPFALWAYRTYFRTSTGATPYSLVYGMETVLPVEIEMGSLRVALEQQISEVIRGLIINPSEKFRPNWSRPYFIRKLTLEGVAWLMDLDGNRFSEPTNVDQVKKYYV
ncbi:hypothetical protein AAG906_012851 [Vitis piasezkii]